MPDNIGRTMLEGAAVGQRFTALHLQDLERLAAERYRDANLALEEQKMRQDAEQFITLKDIQQKILAEEQAQSGLQRQVTAGSLQNQALERELATRTMWDEPRLSLLGRSTSPDFSNQVAAYQKAYGGISPTEFSNLYARYNETERLRAINERLTGATLNAEQLKKMGELEVKMTSLYEGLQQDVAALKPTPSVQYEERTPAGRAVDTIGEWLRFGSSPGRSPVPTALGPGYTPAKVIDAFNKTGRAGSELSAALVNLHPKIQEINNLLAEYNKAGIDIRKAQPPIALGVVRYLQENLTGAIAGSRPSSLQRYAPTEAAINVSYPLYRQMNAAQFDRVALAEERGAQAQENDLRDNYWKMIQEGVDPEEARARVQEALQQLYSNEQTP